MTDCLVERNQKEKLKHWLMKSMPVSKDEHNNQEFNLSTQLSLPSLLIRRYVKELGV